MPGSRITDKQIEIYMHSRENGNTQELSSAKAGISERSGREIERSKKPRQAKERRTWRTRKDPFSSVWDSEIVPLLNRGIFEATFVLGELQKKWPELFPDAQLRTLQRKMKQWRTLYGPYKEVMFLQVHEPGMLGVSDFTHPKEIAVTINGEPLEHIFYHFRLAYSGYSYMQVFRGSGEPFDAFAQGLQEALHHIGGAPKQHRTDSLSASFKNLNQDAKDDVTERYSAFAEHYGMEACRINPGKSHENGAVESPHRHIKVRIEQSLLVRGHNDFDSFESYRTFIQEIVRQHNMRNAKNFEFEKAALQPLPRTKAVEYTELTAIVSCTSTIDVKRVTYSVPSKLIGASLYVKLYNDKLECYVGSILVVSLAREYAHADGRRAHKIDYRHVVKSLIKKPGAFRGYRLRDALLPNDNYRQIWAYVDRTMHSKDAGKFMVGLLHLAALHDCEKELADIVLALIQEGKELKLNELQNKFNKNTVTIPQYDVPQHILHTYNSLIPNYQGI
jgi:Mu transposase-like protein